MELKRALEILEYNKAMLTCDMSIGRNPEHQDVSPDYYGKDAENLYYAIVCVEKYIKSAIPVEWIKNYASHKASKDLIDCYWHFWEEDVHKMLEDWEVENGKGNTNS